MSKLLSVIALSGDRSAAVTAAADDVRAAVLFSIRDGNNRNLTDTAEALRSAGAVRKDGTIATNKKGAILSCLLSAMNGAQSARAVFSNEFAGHKGRPTAAMTERAAAMASAIAEEFENAARAACAPKPKATATATATATADKADKADKATATVAEFASPTAAAMHHAQDMVKAVDDPAALAEILAELINPIALGRALLALAAPVVVAAESADAAPATAARKGRKRATA